MRTLLLLMLITLLPGGLVSAAPMRTRPYVAGDLARDRLQGMDNVLLSSDQVSVSRPGHSGTSLSPAQSKAVSARLSDLVLDDALYVEDAQFDQGGNANSDTFTVGKWGQTVTVFIRRDKPYLTIMRFDGNRMIIANYLPVLPKVIRLLQAVDPSDHSLGNFRPASPPMPVVKGIPASALARIATIKPGMTRADVMHVFTTEGGLSSNLWNHYVYRDYGLAGIGSRDGIAMFSGRLLKVNINYAPHDADIVWLNGRWFWLHQAEYSHRFPPKDAHGQQDDIILRVSPPYLEYMIVD